MKKALIIDDEENARLYLAKMLAASFPEIEVQFAASPSEALFILEKLKTDILFLDVEMPGMSGLEMLQTLREKHSSIPVIIVSAYNKVEFLKKALRLDVIDYLDKPVDPDELECAIKKAFLDKTTLTTPHDIDCKLNLLTDKGLMFIEIDKILYFESDKRNSKVFFTDDKKEILVKTNLIHLEKMLPSSVFKRVSRQYIINTSYIKFVEKDNTITLQTDSIKIKLKKIYPEVISKFTNNHRHFS